jgi:hypothetical protein
VTYRDQQRIEDVLVAIEAIHAHLRRPAAVASQEIRRDRRGRGAERDAAVYSAERGAEDPDGLDAFADYTSRSELDDLD